jgi:GT2 family glycosyltransferase
MNIIPALQYIYERTTEPILALIHDDCKIFENDWDLRVLREFEDPTVGMVGFAGATRHGAPDLYTSPYKLQNLGRLGFASNMRDWQQHGAFFDGVRDVAVYDGFAVFIRRSILDKIGGWPMKATYYLYTEAICCEARKQGYRLRHVGVSCDHLSGKTSSMVQVTDSHEASHRWLFHKYRQVLPFAVGGA